MTDTVSDEQLREYFRKFHHVYAEKIAAAVPEKYLGDISRYVHREQQLVAYISTSWGVGYEYDPTRQGGDIEIIKSSARVEESFLRLPRGAVDFPVFISLRASRIFLQSVAFDGRPVCRLETLDASAVFVDVDTSYDEKTRTIHFGEVFGDRSPGFWSPEKAVERAMDEVLQAAIGVREMERASMPIVEYLARYKRRHVLVLGDFSSEGRQRLSAIKETLRNHGYLAFTLDEVDEVPEYDLRQKLGAVASVCRFVVVDDSSPAGQMVEIAEIEKLRAIMLVMRHRGSRSSFVVRALEATSKIIKEAEYDRSDLDARIIEGVSWAEDRVKELPERFAAAFPWRKR